ncbi:inositol polyphosphate 5-phosphatase K-like isoform X1 [Mya arenaria]|uniref:inositol polyphosphate 5-phosphatase K-like isoform X1 n=1 Tax=Mya arenaria TaxID=6604 RepID=UPI0022DF8A45|nr:inositol polyphosphate 5-phosphatase K-like isoform X1 [Mya arenaria]
MTAANDAIKLLFGVCLYHFYILQYFEEVPKHHSRFRMQQVSDKLHKVSLGKAGAQSSTVSVYLVTWNVGATGPPKDLVELLDLKAKQLPDIYGIGFQEMDPSDGDDKDNQWTSRLTDVLGQMNYVRIKVVRMQAISLQVFVRRPLLLNVTSIESEYSKAGMGGWWGNKGGVSVRFDVGGVNLIIVNTHLAAHMENMAERIEDFNTVLKTQRFRDPDVENILDHDYVFWMGDLNCRLEGISRDRAVELTQQNRLEELFKLDQLKQAQQEGLMLVDFQEGPLNFKPTYKFDKDTDVYDTSEKQRVPAWCDRILWRAHTDLDGLKVQQRKYFSPAYSRGDHKPVTATFLVNPLHYRSHVSYLQSDHKPISGAFDVKVFNEEAYPFVTFDVISKWKYGVDAKFHYSVRKGIEPDTSPWDWIALLPATFKHLDDYKIYVYGKNNAEDIKGGVTLEFSGNDLKVPPGKYQLGYISKHKNWLRGLSNEFEVVA